MHLTQALVLKKIDVGEADSLYSLYTKEFGFMRARARGIRKQGAKLAGHLELLSLGTVGFVLGRAGERLTHAECASFWPGIHARPQKLMVAYAITKLVDEHCFPGSPDVMLWEHIVRTLNELEHSEEDSSGQIERFERGLSQSLGYGGDILSQGMHV